MWSLFLDESGNFDDAEAPVMVGGLLVHESPNRLWDLRDHLEHIYPHVDYPPHRRDLNRAAGVLAAWRRSSRRWTGAWPDFAAIWDRCAREAPLLCDAIEHAVSVGRAYDAVTELDLAMQWFDREGHDALSELDVDCIGRTWDLLDTVGRVRPAYALLALDAGGANQPQRYTERYVALVGALLERVALLTEPTSESEEVVVYWGVRNSLEHRKPLTPAELNGALADAATIAPRRLYWYVAQGSDYDEGVHPGIVLADFICNRTLGPLTHAPRLGPLRDQVRSRTGLDCSMTVERLGGDALSTAAAQGPARTHISRALRSSGLPTSGELDALAPRWVRGMTAQWCTALSQRLGGARP